MRLNEDDWSAFMKDLHATLDTFKIHQPERDEFKENEKIKWKPIGILCHEQIINI